MIFRILCLSGDVAHPAFEPPPTLGPLLFGFGLLLVLFVLINADRRFREYVSRSIMRPFNFFADIRDQRLIPGAQTTILAVILAGALSLCFAALVRLAFDVPTAASTIGRIVTDGTYRLLFNLAHDYTSMLVWFTLISFAAILAVTAILRFCAIFVRGRILLGDTYNITVWSLLPVAFLLPFDLILGRMDLNKTTILLSLWSLLILFLWFFYRILKGTGVLFDIYPTKIYIYGTALLALIAGILFGYLRGQGVL